MYYITHQCNACFLASCTTFQNFQGGNEIMMGILDVVG